MKRISVTAAFLDFSYRVKPFLIRILPIGFIRQIKKTMVNNFMSKLETKAVIIPFSRPANLDGINLIGYIRGEFGLGESCRLMAGCLDKTGLDFDLFNFEMVSAKRFNDHSWDHKITDTPLYNINLIHINPFDLPLAFFRMERKIWDKRYNIAFWLWELETLPEKWINALNLIDEIWTPSEFVSETFRKVTNKPVRTIPYGISTLDCGLYDRSHFGLPENKFLFLCMYDTGSTMERKNPIGVINAYKQAFSPEEQNVGLIVKVNNQQQKDMQVINDALSGYPCVYIISDVLEKKQVNALIACSDVYVSLHRSEGFGLVPAEAMLLGTPVIATNWSANTEFMNSETACMVDYGFITIKKDHGPYEAGNRWADPDIRQAAGYMRKLYDDKEFYQRIAINAKSHITEKLSTERAARLIQNRIAEIYESE